MLNFDFSLKKALVAGFFVLLVIYAIFQARFLIVGPRIYIDTPINGSLASENVIIIEGRAKNIAYISMNGRPIFISSEGNWSEKYIVSVGLNIIKMEARDRFGRQTEKELQIVYK